MSCGNCNCGNGKKGTCPVAFGMAFGLTCAIFMAVFAWVGWLWGYGNDLVMQHAAVYYGYAPTLLGGLWGGLWGFLEGFIFGFLVILFFNCFMRCCKCPSCKGGDASGSCACGKK